MKSLGGRGGAVARDLSRSGVVQRTGPIGRLIRLGWAGLAAYPLTSIVGERGSSVFRNPHILTEASAWLVHLLAVVIFVTLVGALVPAITKRDARPWQGIAVIGLALAVGVSGSVGQLTQGAVWGFPLADAVWVFDVLMFAQQVAAFGLAVVLGTPGCEIGVWPELIARLRHEPPDAFAGLACVVGLQFIDRWEADHSLRL